MIHDIREEMFSLPLDQYILTFDDGLYSQYYYYPRFKEIPTQKVYFISSGIVCNQLQSTMFPTCSMAHQKAFSGNKEDYMTIEQIKELMTDPLVEIGGHSHSHQNVGTITGLANKARHIINDTDLMIRWFETNIGFKPVKFCFPYNDDASGLYRSLLKKRFNIFEFYGKDRIAVEPLLTK